MLLFQFSLLRLVVEVPGKPGAPGGGGAPGGPGGGGGAPGGPGGGGGAPGGGGGAPGGPGGGGGAPGGGGGAPGMPGGGGGTPAITGGFSKSSSSLSVRSVKSWLLTLRDRRGISVGAYAHSKSALRSSVGVSSATASGSEIMRLLGSYR